MLGGRCGCHDFKSGWFTALIGSGVEKSGYGYLCDTGSKTGHSFLIWTSLDGVTTLTWFPWLVLPHVLLMQPHKLEQMLGEQRKELTQGNKIQIIHETQRDYGIITNAHACIIHLKGQLKKLKRVSPESVRR